MPRFFFDLQDGHLFPDHTGSDFADIGTAQDHAVELAEAVLERRAKAGHTHPWHVIIKDEQGDLIGTVTSVQI